MGNIVSTSNMDIHSGQTEAQRKYVYLVLGASFAYMTVRELPQLLNSAGGGRDSHQPRSPSYSPIHRPLSHRHSHNHPRSHPKATTPLFLSLPWLLPRVCGSVCAFYLANKQTRSIPLHNIFLESVYRKQLLSLVVRSTALVSLIYFAESYLLRSSSKTADGQTSSTSLHALAAGGSPQYGATSETALTAGEVISVKPLAKPNLDHGPSSYTEKVLRDKKEHKKKKKDGKNYTQLSGDEKDDSDFDPNAHIMDEDESDEEIDLGGATGDNMDESPLHGDTELTPAKLLLHLRDMPSVEFPENLPASLESIVICRAGYEVLCGEYRWFPFNKQWNLFRPELSFAMYCGVEVSKVYEQLRMIQAQEKDFVWNEEIKHCWVISDLEGNAIYYAAPQLDTNWIPGKGWISVHGSRPIPKLIQHPSHQTHGPREGALPVPKSPFMGSHDHPSARISHEEGHELINEVIVEEQDEEDAEDPLSNDELDLNTAKDGDVNIPMPDDDDADYEEDDEEDLSDMEA